MANLGIGALGYVGYAKETVEGTGVTPTKFLAVDSASFPDSNDYLTPMQVRGRRDLTVALPAPFSTSGSMDLAFPADDIGYLLKSAFAATVATSSYAGGGYTHVLSPANASDTFSFETSAAGVLVMRYTGVRVNTLEIKATFGEIVQASFGLEGIDRAKQGSAATPSYAASSITPFHFIGTKVQIGGADNGLVKDFSFSVGNNVERVGTLRSTRAYRRVALGPRDVGLSMTLDFDDTVEYDRFIADSEFAVKLYMEAGTITSGTGKNSLMIDLPRVKYKTVGVPIEAGSLLSQDIECTILAPVAAQICTVTLVNVESTLA